LVLALFAALATAAGAAAPLYAQTAPTLMLRPGDVLKVTVWDAPTFSGEFEVAPDGTLRHPLLNRVSVAGVPLDTVRARLVAFLRDYQREPALDLAPLVRVTVAGEVRSPGIYLLPPETSLADAIVKAGAATPLAKERSVALERGGRQYSFDPGATSLEQALRTVQSGDRLAVPRRRASNLQPYLTTILSLTAALGSAYLSAYLVIQSRRDQ